MVGKGLLAELLLGLVLCGAALDARAQVIGVRDGDGRVLGAFVSHGDPYGPVGLQVLSLKGHLGTYGRDGMLRLPTASRHFASPDCTGEGFTNRTAASDPTGRSSSFAWRILTEEGAPSTVPSMVEPDAPVAVVLEPGDAWSYLSHQDNITGCMSFELENPLDLYRPVPYDAGVTGLPLIVPAPVTIGLLGEEGPLFEVLEDGFEPAR